MIALVVGGAACVWGDLAALAAWKPDTVIAVNDMIGAFPGRIDVAATLHAEKLDRWRLERWRQGGNPDYVTWGRPEKPGTDRVLGGWTSGSSGMFGVGVALELGADVVLLAGVPMDPRPHFFDHTAWDSFRLYRAAWEKRADRLRGRVFSVSGWTRDLLGPPPAVRKEAA